MADKPVVVYGASGFSGRLIVEFLREYGVPFVAAGRDKGRLEEVLDHVPGISTANYEIVQVGHSVDELTDLFRGAKVVCNSVGPCIYYGDTVVEASLAAGCHYLDTGGETPWVRSVRENWHDKFSQARLLVAPATAYMSATAEAAIKVAQEHAPGIGTIDVLSMFLGMPTYGSTQTIFGQLQWESIYLQENEYVEWPPVTTIEALIPGEFRTRLALPWGGFPHPVWFKDDPHDRRHLSARQPGIGPGCRPRAGGLPADRLDPGLRGAPPRLPAAARVRFRLAVFGVRAPRAACRARSLRARPAEGGGLIKVRHGCVIDPAANRRQPDPAVLPAMAGG